MPIRAMDVLTANAVSPSDFVNPHAFKRTIDEAWSHPWHCDCDASRIRTRALEILSRMPTTRSRSEQREWLHDRSDPESNPELFNLQGVRRLVGRLDWQSRDPGIGAPSIGRERRLDGDTETVTGCVPVQLRQQNSKASKNGRVPPRSRSAAHTGASG